MTQFNQFKDLQGVDVYVNPTNVLYITTHKNEPRTTFIYLAGGAELAVKEEVASVVSSLQKIS